MRTTNPGFEGSTLNAYVVTPQEVFDRDRFGYKIIAVVRGDTWMAYRGPTGWTDAHVAKEGDQINQVAAEILFPALTQLEYYGD